MMRVRLTSVFILFLLTSCKGGSYLYKDTSCNQNTDVVGGDTVVAMDGMADTAADVSGLYPDVPPIPTPDVTIAPPLNKGYVVFAWNDLGMHCLNPTYDTVVLLPPYNTVWAQVVRKDVKPEIVTTGITVEYRILNNTSSYGKTDPLGGDFKQFWDNVQALFGVTLEHNTGLNLENPDLHNGLSGQMVASGDHFQVNGIPVVPVDDDGTWNPYQIMEVTVKNDQNSVLAVTLVTVPTSDEITCTRCHGANPFENQLLVHPKVNRESLANMKPVLCASCHGSPALGQSGPGTSGKYLSQAIHGFHATKNAVCYDCHPGHRTKCNRSLSHTTDDGNCIECHGTMQQVADSINSDTSGNRIPWVNEPKCVTCHGPNIAEVDTGDLLYRNAKGHGGMYCASCHSSPHAMVPSSLITDNYQALQYQNKAKTIGSCGACHSSSRGATEGGEGENEFLSTHGGLPPDQASACQVCHTGVVGDTPLWPHQFQWKAR